MPKQMGAKPLNTSTLLQPAEHLPNGSVGDGPEIGHKEKTVRGSTAGTAGHIPEKDFADGEAERNNPLLVTLAVHNEIPFRDMNMVKSKGNNFMKAKAAVQHKGTDTEITELNEIPGIKAGKKTADFRIGQNINRLSLCLGKPELFREVVRYVLLLIAPGQKGTQSTDIGLSGNCGDIPFRKGQRIAFKAVQGDFLNWHIRTRKTDVKAHRKGIILNRLRGIPPNLLFDKKF